MLGYLRAIFGKQTRPILPEREIRSEPFAVDRHRNPRFFEAQDMISQQTLSIPKVRLPNSFMEVPSFSSKIRVYRVSLAQQTCTCPDYTKKHRKEFEEFNLARWCKHLAAEIKPYYNQIQLDDWKRYLLETGRGGPLGVCKLFLKTAPPIVITSDGNFDWLTILARTKKNR